MVSSLLLVMQRNFGQICSVLYFDTELKFDPQRVVEIARYAFPSVFGGLEVSTSSESLLTQLLDSIKVFLKATGRIEVY